MTLNNNNEDPSLANQVLAYSFFQKSGVPTPRTGLAHLTVNGEDLGVYTHVETINKTFTKRQFGRADGDLYEGLAGDFTENEFKYIVHKSGKDDNRRELTKFFGMIRKPGPLSLSSLEEYMDLDAFIRFWAAEVLIGNEDGYPGNRNNYYLYRDRKSAKFHFIPWGADTSFREGPFDKSDESKPKSVWIEGALCRRLWELPEVQTRYKNEITRLLKTFGQKME